MKNNEIKPFFLVENIAKSYHRGVFCVIFFLVSQIVAENESMDFDNLSILLFNLTPTTPLCFNFRVLKINQFRKEKRKEKHYRLPKYKFAVKHRFQSKRCHCNDTFEYVNVDNTRGMNWIEKRCATKFYSFLCLQKWIDLFLRSPIRSTIWLIAPLLTTKNQFY